MRHSRRRLSRELGELQVEIEGYARGFGLDFFDVIFEVLDYEEINMVASYGGFPVRYPHWKWGMEYERMQKSYTYGLHRIYEMVINNDPCYAYLLESNTIVDQKTVMGHVYAHCDFFKNNFCFDHTSRKMMDEMANHATHIRRYMDRLGVEKVENFIDACLSLENLIDYNAPYLTRKPSQPERRNTRSKALQSEAEARADEAMFHAVSAWQDEAGERPRNVGTLGKIPNEREYMESYINPPAYLEEQRQKAAEKAKERRKIPANAERDVLGFLLEHAPLQRWQHDVLEMLRDEAYYFAPQGMTKIMNEGWASYWHSTIMTQKALRPSEFIDFADHHSGVVASQGMQLNPYKLGIELYRDIEDRWNKGRFGKDFNECDDISARRRWDTHAGLGREKIMEVRRLYKDITFIDEFLTLDFVREHKLFSFGYNKQHKRWEIESRQFAEVKKQLLDSLTNMSQPNIAVEDSNFENRAELLLVHTHEGADLDPSFAAETLKNLFVIWTRPVNIRTVGEGKAMMLRFDGKEYSEKNIESA